MMSAAAEQASKTSSKTKKVSRNGQRHATHTSHSSSSTVMTVPVVDESQMVELERHSKALAAKLDRLNSDMSLPGDDSEDLNRSITECQSRNLWTNAMRLDIPFDCRINTLRLTLNRPRSRLWNMTLNAVSVAGRAWVPACQHMLTIPV
jgi:hypothetical protein